MLREDLFELKLAHLEMNLKRQLENQRSALKSENIRDAEQFELKCFAPIKLLDERRKRH